MITAETIYQKVKTLDTQTLQEVSNFLDFMLSKRNEQTMKEEMRKHFPTTEFEAFNQKPVYTTKTLTIEAMDAAVEYEAGHHK